jgi:hypothetical protein
MRALGFDNYEEVLKIYLTKYRDVSLPPLSWAGTDGYSINSLRQSRNWRIPRTTPRGSERETTMRRLMGGRRRGRTARRRRRESRSRWFVRRRTKGSLDKPRVRALGKCPGLIIASRRVAETWPPYLRDGMALEDGRVCRQAGRYRRSEIIMHCTRS